MTKLNFLFALRDKLSGFDSKDVEERLSFYCEMIEDRMEEGLSEEEAVSAVGDLEEIVAQIKAELPLPQAAPQKSPPKRSRSIWVTGLLILGFPLWFSLLIAAFATVLSLYVSFGAVIITFWAVFVSLALCGFALTVAGIVVSLTGAVSSGLVMTGAGLVCGGLSIFFFFLSRWATLGIAKPTGTLFGLLFHKKEVSS